MKPPTLIVADDFAPEVDAIRKHALVLPYGTVNYKGNDYEGVAGFYLPHVDRLIGDVLGFPVIVRLGFFRLGIESTKQTTYIHADNAESEFAGVLYLNLPHQKHGGTAFWKHRATELEEVHTGLRPDLCASLVVDGMDESKWDMQMIVRMKYNRFICYPSRCFHSRYPNDCQAKTKDEGRLVYATFFDRA